MQDRLAERKEGVARLGDGLRLLSPLSVLQRGYSITLDAESGAVVRDAAGLAPGRRLKTRLARGEVASVVEPGPSVKASPAR
jgi:exodeoxyribonuclease VII large subunit